MIKELKAGDPVAVGPYKLLGRLGAGGMGQVYLAKSPGGRLVAIKLIRPELAEERGFRTRFAGEIAAARNVSGIYTAAVVDADSDAELPWMATVYVPGPSLTDAVEDHGPLPLKTVLALAAGLAEALEAIHRAGLVHRDMKPSNVLLASDGPRVIDFGISRALERSMMTTTGMVLGSPGFMSPEQATGEQVGQPTDVFSLGAVLAYAATGAGPFGAGPTPALLYRVVKEEPDLTKVPGRLRPLVTQCMAKDPAQRPTPAALLAALSDEIDVLTGEWLPQQIADGMSRYSPTLQTPLPPSLRDPDSVPGQPVLPAEMAGAAASTPEPATFAPPVQGQPAAAALAAADLAAAPAASGPVTPVTPVPVTPPPATMLAAASGPVPSALAAPLPAGATRAEYTLPETSLVPMPGGPAPVARSGPAAAVPAGPVGPAGPARPAGGTPAANPRRRLRWWWVAAVAVLVVIAAVAAFALAGSPGGTHPSTGLTSSASAGKTRTSSPSATATAARTAGQPTVTATGSAPAAQPSTAPAYATSSAASTPTATASPTLTSSPTASATATATATPTATATSTPTTTQTATATATATSSQLPSPGATP